MNVRLSKRYNKGIPDTTRETRQPFFSVKHPTKQKQQKHPIDCLLTITHTYTFNFFRPNYFQNSFNKIPFYFKIGMYTRSVQTEKESGIKGYFVNLKLEEKATNKIKQSKVEVDAPSHSHLVWFSCLLIGRIFVVPLFVYWSRKYTNPCLI